MKTIQVFFASGFEEIEAIAIVDVLRRASFTVTMVSVTDRLQVVGAHEIPVVCDMLFSDSEVADILVLPGGMPGTTNLKEHKELCNLLISHAAQNKIIAAICAAPSVLGGLGLLEGKEATCYPSFEPTLIGATVINKGVVVSQNIITGKGPGVAIEFALTIVEQVLGKEKAVQMANQMIVG